MHETRIAMATFEWTCLSLSRDCEQPHQVERVCILVPGGDFLGRLADGGLIHEPVCHHFRVYQLQRVVWHTRRRNQSHVRVDVHRTRELEGLDRELHT